MADVSTPAAAMIPTTGLTILGIATGLDPSLLIAGFAGALWSQSYAPASSIWHRILITTIVAVVSGYLTPAAAMGLASLDTAKNAALTFEVLKWPVAVLFGLLAHSVIGPAVMKYAARKGERIAE